MKLRTFTTTILFVVAFAASAQRSQIIRCESDGGMRECRFDAPADVRLERQLSRTDCVEGRNWGFNNNGIWVDDGCRAEFTLGRRRGGGGYGRDREPSERIVCESDFDHTHRCSIDLRGGSVRISRQLSRTDCVYGRTWGYSNREIWVSNGCRAEFEVGR